MSERRRNANPFRGISDIVSEMNRMSERMVGIDAGPPARERGHTDAWNPTTDIVAEGADVIIRCELAGVVRNDVEVTLSQGTLTISGQRRPGPESDDVFYLRERFIGWFRREVTLPEGVREEHITPRFVDGVLEVRVRGAVDATGPARIAIEG